MTTTNTTITFPTSLYERIREKAGYDDKDVKLLIMSCFLILQPKTLQMKADSNGKPTQRRSATKTFTLECGIRYKASLFRWGNNVNTYEFKFQSVPQYYHTNMNLNIDQITSALILGE